MNVALGSIAWQLLLAMLAVALAVSTGRRKLGRKERLWQLVCALSLLAGAVVGLVPAVSIASLFNGLETLLAFGPPTLTLAICGALVVDPAALMQGKTSVEEDQH